jgi:hypothetical protein
VKGKAKSRSGKGAGEEHAPLHSELLLPVSSQYFEACDPDEQTLTRDDIPLAALPSLREHIPPRCSNPPHFIARVEARATCGKGRGPSLI